MTDNPQTCGNCAYKSDGFQEKPDYCYCIDATVEKDGTCPEWRGSLRDEPLESAPLNAKED